MLLHHTFFYFFFLLFFFFFNDTATTEIYTLSLHDALPIYGCGHRRGWLPNGAWKSPSCPPRAIIRRSEEHTSELQSQSNLVCRLLLEKKKKKQNHHSNTKKENKKKRKHR